MNLVPKPAQGSNALPRARRPAFTFPRTARLLALAITPLLLAQPSNAQKRREAILQLRDDVSTAMAHATLTEKQTQKLDHCRQTLLLAAQSGKMRKAATKRDLDGAVKDIEKAFGGGPFQADDRAVVREDIAQLRAIERDQQLKRAGMR
jgi:hypothetical protein